MNDLELQKRVRQLIPHEYSNYLQQNGLSDVHMLWWIEENAPLLQDRTWRVEVKSGVLQTRLIYFGAFMDPDTISACLTLDDSYRADDIDYRVVIQTFDPGMKPWDTIDLGDVVMMTLLPEPLYLARDVPRNYDRMTKGSVASHGKGSEHSQFFRPEF